jgi:CubicO group peptidase (beta-lactamase class C family)
MSARYDRKTDIVNSRASNQLKHGAAFETSATEAMLKQELSSGKTPGISYAFFDASGVRYQYQGGLCDVAARKELNRLTMFHGFSITKTFTALAVLQLEERGQIRLEDPVTRYLPGFMYGDGVTIQHLLNHTAGIPNPIPLTWIHLAEEHGGFDRHAFFAQVFAKYPRLKSPPGDRFAYSNLGYIILGDLIAQVSGERYEDYITKHILNELAGPGDLGFLIDERVYAKGYQSRYSLMNLALGFFIDKRKFMGPAEGRWKPFRTFYMNGAPYGGILATAGGLISYGQALLQRGRLITEAGKARLFTDHHTPDGRPTGM